MGRCTTLAAISVCVAAAQAAGQIVPWSLGFTRSTARASTHQLDDTAQFGYPADAATGVLFPDHTATTTHVVTGETDVAAFEIDSTHLGNYFNGSWSQARTEIHLQTSVDALYELSGALGGTPDADHGRISVSVFLTRWEGGFPVDTLFHQSRLEDIAFTREIVLGEPGNGDLEGSLEGVLLAGEHYSLEVIYTLDSEPDGTNAEALGYADLVLTPVPAPGAAAVLLLAGMRRRRG